MVIDNANCGGCGRSCGAGQCVESMCRTVPVVLNEFMSPWIEIHNLSNSAVNMSGWTVITVPLGVVQASRVALPSSIAALGYLVIELGMPFDYNQGVGIYDASANLVDALGSTPPVTSWARCPDGRGPWRNFATPTKGSANVCQ
jgi:hypothetical protein